MLKPLLSLGPFFLPSVATLHLPSLRLLEWQWQQNLVGKLDLSVCWTVYCNAIPVKCDMGMQWRNRESCKWISTQSLSQKEKGSSQHTEWKPIPRVIISVSITQLIWSKSEPLQGFYHMLTNVLFFVLKTIIFYWQNHIVTQQESHMNLWSSEIIIM